MQKIKMNVYRDYEDALFRATVYRAAEAEGERYAGEMNAEVETRKFEQSRERFRKLLDEKLREKTRGDKYPRVYRRFRKGAVLLAAVVVVFAVAMLTVGAFRNQVFNLMLGVREEYTSFQLQEQEGSGGRYVVDWENAYVPTVIPDGYEIGDVYLTNDIKYIVFHSIQDEGRTITYTEYADDAWNIQLDTESASFVETVAINGNQGTLTEKDGVVKLVWVLDGHMFELTGRADREDILQIAESVKFHE